MDNPGNAAISETANVSDIVKQITTDEAGNYIFPTGVELTEEMKFAATAEKRRRDTQAEFTKTQKAKIALEAENAKLRETLLKQTIVFSPEEAEELEDLKLENPEKWRQRLNELEQKAIENRQTSISTISTEVKTQAELNFEVSLRGQVLEDFNKFHGISLTEELLTEEVPNRITKKLVDGKVSYEEYLEECFTYLKTNKAIKEEQVMENPNLNRISGGKEPGKFDAEPSLKTAYKNDLY